MSSLDLLMIAAASAKPSPIADPAMPPQQTSRSEAVAAALAAASSLSNGPFHPRSTMAAPEVNKYFEMRALALSQQASLADAASFYPSFSQKVRGHAKRKRSEEGSLSGPTRSDSCDSIKDMTPVSTISDAESDAPSTPDSRPMLSGFCDAKSGHSGNDVTVSSKKQRSGTPVTPETSSPRMAAAPLALAADAFAVTPSGLPSANVYKHEQDVSSLLPSVTAFDLQQQHNKKKKQKLQHSAAQQQAHLLLEQHAMLQQLQQQHKLQRQLQEHQQKPEPQRQSKSQLQQYLNSQLQQSLSATSMPMRAHTLAAAAMMGLLPNMMPPNRPVPGVSGLQKEAEPSTDTASLSALLSGAKAAQAECTDSDLSNMVMHNPYVMALNSAMRSAMLGQIGGMEVRKAETRRREQRRLSAQRRRERKRGTLSELEAKVCAAKKMDADLGKQLKQHLDEAASAGCGSAQSVLDKCDAAILEPVFPVWNDILDKARKEARQSTEAELDAKSVGATEKDKLTIRRERNRISARMSRLRKRLRQEYLEKNLDILSKRINVVKSALEAGGVRLASDQ